MVYSFTAGSYILLQVSAIKKTKKTLQALKQGLQLPKPVLRIRICMFFDLQDPDLSIIKQDQDPYQNVMDPQHWPKHDQTLEC